MPSRSAGSRLVRNLASTTAFQASGYILAMLNVPYLTRTLGVADYGVLAFVISINAYLFLIIDWGFSLGATRDIAQARGDEEVIRAIFWRTMTAKCILSLLSLVALFCVAELNRVPNAALYLILPGLLNIVGAVLSVDWLVQGLERMGLFSMYSIAGRMLVVGLTFLLVHSPQDTWIACALQGFGSLVGSGAGFLIACRFLKMGKPKPVFREAARQIWDYRHYFLSQSSWIAYSTAAPLFLTFASGSKAVGLFAGAERIARIVMALIVPVSMVMYPRVNALIARSRDAAANVAGPFLALQILFASVITVIFFFAATPIVVIILGPHFIQSAAVLRWLSLLPLLTGITGTLSRQFLIPLGWSKEVSRMTVGCTLLYLALLAVFCHYMGAPGAAIALIMTETILTVVFVAFLWRRERQFAATSALAVWNAPRDLMHLLQNRSVKARSS